MSFQFSTQTVNTLCFQALRTLNIVGRGQSASSQQLADALYLLNELLDSWSATGAMIYAVNLNEYNIVTPFKQFYTIGPGGDFDTGSNPRPVNITTGTYQIQGGSTPNDMGMVQVTIDEYTLIASKQTTSTVSTVFCYQPEFPLGIIRFWPLPAATTVIKFTSYNSFPTILAAPDSVVFPPAYSKAIRLLLVQALAPLYGKNIPTDIAAEYNAIKDDLITANIAQRIGKMVYPSGMPQTGGVYNIFTDSTYRGF